MKRKNRNKSATKKAPVAEDTTKKQQNQNVPKSSIKDTKSGAVPLPIEKKVNASKLKSNKCESRRERNEHGLFSASKSSGGGDLLISDESETKQPSAVFKTTTDEENSQSLTDTSSSTVSPASSSSNSDTSDSYLLIEIKMISVDFGLYASDFKPLSQSFLCVNANATAAHLISLITKKMDLTNKEFEVRTFNF